MDALIYRVMTYEELLGNLATISGKNETGTLQLKGIDNKSDIRKEIKKQEEQYNREVNKDMKKNRKQWEEIYAKGSMNKAESNESLTDPATISGDPDDI